MPSSSAGDGETASAGGAVSACEGAAASGVALSPGSEACRPSGKQRVNRRRSKSGLFPRGGFMHEGKKFMGIGSVGAGNLFE